MLSPSDAKGLAIALRQTWTATMGFEPGDLEQDLEATRTWFDPVAQGERLRKAIFGLSPLPMDLVNPGPPLIFPIDAQRRLVTPEGRCCIELLGRSLAANDRIVLIDDTTIQPLERRIAMLYRDWSQHRLRSVAELLAGQSKPLQIAAAGVVLALLVNRSTGPERAVTRYAAGAARDDVDSAFLCRSRLSPTRHLLPVGARWAALA